MRQVEQLVENKTLLAASLVWSAAGLVSSSGLLGAHGVIESVVGGPGSNHERGSANTLPKSMHSSLQF